MKINRLLPKAALFALLSLLSPAQASADSVFRQAAQGLSYFGEAQATFSGDYSPLWLNANRYGMSSVDGTSGYLRVGLSRSVQADSARNWRIGYGLDVAAAYGFTSTFVVQQLYVELQYRWLRLAVGSKERLANLKNAELSSGSQTLGVNARPVPQVRLEIPEYVSITGQSNWLAVRGHLGYGMLTDGRWQEDYAAESQRYARKVLYHSKAGFLRIGNEEKFPLVLEGGVEMACLFGGDVYNYDNEQGKNVARPNNFSSFWHAFVPGGSDPADDVYSNAEGNTLGSWLFSLSYNFGPWRARAYYDHYFEDHSQMFFEYGWRDGLYGIEITLPHNSIASTLVYEYMYTKYQSGPLYHDHTDAIPDQISAADNYYNSALYGWHHWGQSMGNPLFTTFLYANEGSLTFTSNRFIAHHAGMAGDPLPWLHYRVLYTNIRSWGTYSMPYSDVKKNNSFLVEASFFPSCFKGWQVEAAFSFDHGDLIGNNMGVQFTVRYSGILIPRLR